MSLSDDVDDDDFDATRGDVGGAFGVTATTQQEAPPSTQRQRRYETVFAKVFHSILTPNTAGAMLKL